MMSSNGYSMRQDSPGKWTVYDTYSGKPVVYNDIVQTNLTEDDANEILELLRQDYIEKSTERNKPA